MKYDYCILGSGFSGALLAWILAKAGRRVALLDAATHPRFAIGESSTPLADFLLERIADEFSLPEVRPLARYGSWRQQQPGLACGLKRGFSYFAHQPGQEFQDDRAHASSLLVSASESDQVGDTHWMRSDVDAWLVEQAQNSGVLVHQGVRPFVSHGGGGWKVRHSDSSATEFEMLADMVIDASGGGQAISGLVGANDISDRLRVRTGAMFGHFEGVAPMSAAASAATGLAMTHYKFPFDADDAAQHHLLGPDCWCWMLRFCQGTTSVGIVGPQQMYQGAITVADRRALWQQVTGNFPTLRGLMLGARLIAPLDQGAGGQLASLGWCGRISRCLDAGASPAKAGAAAWAMLPSTVGVVDPLHSTGIAHSLSGVYRLAQNLLGTSRANADAELFAYSDDVVAEVLWIDEIISLCRQGQTINFEVFSALCSFYFVAAIHCERQLATGDEMNSGFLLQRDQRLRQLVGLARQRVSQLQVAKDIRGKKTVQFVDWLQGALGPWNDVGLMDPTTRNRVVRSTAPK